MDDLAFVFRSRFPAGRIAVLIRKYLIEKDLLAKSAIIVHPEMDFSGISPAGREIRHSRAGAPRAGYSTVTLLAKLRGWSTSVPLRTATW
jgi:hypothetical protein